MDKSLVLRLTVSGVSVRYQVRTTAAVQVAQMKFENDWLYVVEQTVLEANEQGYVLQIDIVHTTQKATDLFSRVTADVNQATRRLVLQTDQHGQLLHVLNQADVLGEWARIRPQVRARYAHEPATQPFLDAFEQQLAQPGSLEPNLRDKGLYSALLVGVYGQPYASPLHTQRRIEGFFTEIALPLCLVTTAAPAPAGPGPAAVLVNTTATLDKAAFAADDFRRLLRDIVDDYALPVELVVAGHSQHVLDAYTGQLQRSQQQLVAEVAGIYRNAVTHEIFSQPAP